MASAPSFTLRFGNTFILGLVGKAKEEFGWSDTGLSRDAFGGNPDAVKTFRLWDGARRSPTLRTAATIEAHIRANLGEEIYQEQSISLMADMVVPSILALAAETGRDADEIAIEFSDQVRRGILAVENEREAA